GVCLRRDRSDLREVAGTAAPSQRSARGHVFAERDPRMIGRRSMVTSWQRLVPGSFGALALLAAVALSGCRPQPTYQVVQSPPPARTGTVESLREVVEQKDPSWAGLIVGGLVCGGLGRL